MKPLQRNQYPNYNGRKDSALCILCSAVILWVFMALSNLHNSFKPGSKTKSKANKLVNPYISVKPFCAEHRTVHFPNMLEWRASQRQAHRQKHIHMRGRDYRVKTGVNPQNESQHLRLCPPVFLIRQQKSIHMETE